MHSALVALADGAKMVNDDNAGWLAVLIYAIYVVPGAFLVLGIGAWVYAARRGARERRAATTQNTGHR
jgi:hypothetical protein